MPPAVRRFSRTDTFELKVEIEKRLGAQKADKYFNLLTKYLSLRIRKSEFDKLCVGIIGRENVRLHNQLLIAIVRNAKIPIQKHVRTDGPLSLKVPKVHPVTGLQSVCAFPQSPKKGRTPNLRERKFKDRAVGVAQRVATTKVQEQQQQSATELLSLGSKPPLEVNSVEDGEEVEQGAISPGVLSRNPVRAPLGISIRLEEKRKVHKNGLDYAYHTETCHCNGHLPATNFLKKRLNHSLQMEGLDVSVDCVNLLNNGLDCFLTSVLRPSFELARSRSSKGSSPGTGSPFLTSMLDFRMTMNISPMILGEVSHILH